MTSKEFAFGVVTSIVAAIVFEVAGMTTWSKKLAEVQQLPLWAIAALVVVPVLGSIFWFRRYVSPQHKALQLAHRSSLAEIEGLKSHLDQARATLGQLEITQSKLRSELAAAEEQLQDWRTRGIMMFDPKKGPEEVTGKNFGPEVVEIDGKKFERCVFHGTILKYRGIGPVVFDSDDFYDIRWVFDAPASNAFAMLRAMYKSGSPEMVEMIENTLANIRGEVAPARQQGPNFPGSKPT